MFKLANFSLFQTFSANGIGLSSRAMISSNCFISGRARVTSFVMIMIKLIIKL